MRRTAALSFEMRSSSVSIRRRNSAGLSFTEPPCLSWPCEAPRMEERPDTHFDVAHYCEFAHNSHY